MARLTLSTDEGEREDPDAAAVSAALSRLSAEPESYALLASEAGAYLQATRSAGRLSLERQEGSARFAWEGEPSAADLAAAFAGFQAGDGAWKDDPRWRRSTDEDAAREHRAAVLAALNAAPLKVPRSADGSLWSSSNGEVTALFAFSTEESLRETCPEAGVLVLPAPELLRRFLDSPQQMLFVEAAGDWLSVDKAEAKALLEHS